MRKKKFHFTSVMVTVLSLFALSAHADTSDMTKVVWGYKGNIGPERWSQLSPDFTLCATGKLQSPINIPSKTNAASNALNIQYQPAAMNIIKDGSTELMLGNTSVIIKDGHAVQLNFPVDTKETISLEGKNYRLVQFHVHTPSENTWHGRQFPLEVHFVHQSDDGEVAVIGVWANEGDANQTIAKIISHLPNEQNKEIAIQGEGINPADLLPTKRDYYRFDGSLTTPPCSEGLKWILMSNPITVSAGEVIQLRTAIGGPNARPIQPLNKRQIYFVSSK